MLLGVDESIAYSRMHGCFGVGWDQVEVHKLGFGKHHLDVEFGIIRVLSLLVDHTVYHLVAVDRVEYFHVCEL